MTFRPTFHAARLESSTRLQRALEVIQKAGNMTGREWCQAADIMNPGGVASELWENGYWVQAVYLGMNENGRKVWKYFYRGERSDHEIETKTESIA